MLFLVGDGNSEKSTFSYASNNILKTFKRLTYTTLDRLPTWFYLNKNDQIFSPGIFGLSLRNNELFNWADLIHIHWANHGMIDIKEIKKWDKQIVWTIRDMWPFTGGCHHSFNCEKYKLKCGSCPVLGSDVKKDLSSFVLRKKIKYLSVLPIKWVAISSWMKAQASSSQVLKKKQISVIFSGIDCKIFKVTSKKKSRLAFNFPLNKKIILVGAGNLRDKYKGFNYLINLLNKVKKDHLVVTFGSGALNKNEIPQRIINLGYIDNNKDLSTLYNSADVFLAPSVAEAFGKTFAEAQACGLQVVCFNKTGPEDIVEHLKTGYLAKFEDEKDLLKGLRFCLKMTLDSIYISTRSKSLFDINSTAKKYISLYKNCMRKGKISSK